MGPYCPQDGPYGVPTVIWRHNRNFRFSQKIDDRGVVEYLILGHGNFLRFWPIFWTQWVPIGPKMDPRGPPLWFVAITVTSIFLEKSMIAGKSKIRILEHVNFLPFWTIFFIQWDPIDPKMDPRGSPPWFIAITVTSIYWEKSMIAG